MQTYQVLPNGMIFRESDAATIPPDPENGDYRRYLEERDAPIIDSLQILKDKLENNDG